MPNELNAMDNRKQEALRKLQEQQQRLEMSWSSRLRPRRRVERRIVFGNDTAPAPARRRSADKKSPTSSNDIGARISLRSRRGKGLSPITTTQNETSDPFPACCSPVLRTASPCRVPRQSGHARNGIEESPVLSPAEDAVWPTWTSPAMLRLSNALNTSVFMQTPTPMKASYTPSATPCKDHDEACNLLSTDWFLCNSSSKSAAKRATGQDCSHQHCGAFVDLQ